MGSLISGSLVIVVHKNGKQGRGTRSGRFGGRRTNILADFFFFGVFRFARDRNS